MIDKLSIYNFRGLNDLIIDDLSHVNIFVGANNSGKTSVLEALHLMGSPNNIGRLVELALLRSQSTTEIREKNRVNYMLSILQKVSDENQQSHYHIKLGVSAGGHDYEYEAYGTLEEITDSVGTAEKMLDIAIETSVDNGKVNVRHIEITNGENAGFSSKIKPVYKALYLHSTVSYYRNCANLLADYIVQEGKTEALHILQAFDANIDDISIVGEDIYLHNTLSGTMPLFAYGSGLQKAVLLTVAIVYCKNGAILIDEIDNAIHVSAFEDVFRWFLDVCLKWNVQAFITTHSAEALDAILKIANEKRADKDVLRIITLRKNYSSNTTSKRIRSGEEAYSDRASFKMELRV